MNLGLQGNPANNKLLVTGLLLIVFMVGLVLRMGALSQTELIGPIRGDSTKYLSYAHNLTHYGVYSGTAPATGVKQGDLKPDAVVTPGYPLFLSLFLQDDQPTTMLQVKQALQFQTFLSALCVVMIYFVFKPVLGAFPSLGVALLTAISPHLVNANVYLLTESFFGFLFVAWLFLLSNITREQSWGLLFLCGVMLGAAALTRSWIQYFVVFLVPMLLWASRHLFVQKGLVAAFAVGYLAVISVWLGRNLMVLGSLGDSSLMLASLQTGMYPDLTYQSVAESIGVPYQFDPQSKYITSSLTAFFNVLIERFIEQPWQHFQWYLWGKASTVLSWDIIAGVGDIFVYPMSASPYLESTGAIYAERTATLPVEKAGLFGLTHALMRSLHAPLTLLAFIGAAVVWWPKAMLRFNEKQRWFARVLSMLFIYFVVIHVIVSPYPRYSIPTRPLVYGLSLFVVVMVYEWLKAAYQSKSAVAQKVGNS